MNRVHALVPRLRPFLRVRRFGTVTCLRKDDDFYGHLTKEEYEKASNDLKKQIRELEKSIKGDTNIRENLGHMPSFPMATGKKPRVDNLPLFLEETIKTTGPLPLSTYMRQCLTHPVFGYYTTRDPLNLRTGDFITSPEISSVFGEMIGVYLFQVWNLQNKPKHVRIIEFGPGRGTLMHDTLTSFNKLMAKFGTTDIEIEMIETSRVLRAEQHKLLCGSEKDMTKEDESVTKWGNKIKWLENESEVTVDDRANFVIAHEFFDALPIKAFQKTEHGWREFMVDHSPTVAEHQQKIESAEPVAEDEDSPFDTEFHLTLAPKQTPSSTLPDLNPRIRDLEVGSQIEICPDAEFFMTKMAKLINNDTKQGTVLIIDYGVVDQVPGMTLRGIYRHKFVSPFFKPGEVDLSIDVDFTNLCELAKPHAKVLPVVDQGDWLHEMGIGHRIHRLIQRADENAQQKIYDSYLRLTNKDDQSMGGIYKFMGLVPEGSETPLGFKKLM